MAIPNSEAPSATFYQCFAIATHLCNSFNVTLILISPPMLGVVNLPWTLRTVADSVFR